MSGVTLPSISPTLLCADQLSLGSEVAALEAFPICWHHVDVMDGHFVPNLAFGLDGVEAIRRCAKKPILVHLMVDDPDAYYERLARLQADFCVFHIEATRSPFRSARRITELGMKPGIAVSPTTPIDSLADLVNLLDVVLLMGVEPGFSGQPFLEHTYGRISALRGMVNSVGARALIEVDGGIDDRIAGECVARGADVIVGGAFTLFAKAGGLASNFARLSRAMTGGRT